ncbi:hypothetical protein [Ruegeria sp. R14_0]|uniref:hypothetical protein n=1 Tax=Ruegeria sp. R14_0 TaxID=2821100 RepID=UPI001AD9D218|nr:hypothetical protein [Ruegeria sp. R14_0]MBO9445788.1 hypothetical protein [Ruegeria sp. R14_0]
MKLTSPAPNVTLILNSLLLSIRVTLRMIVPILVIMLASIIVWTVLGVFTLGMAGYISEPVTTAFITLFGIRVALELKGDKRHTDFRAMVLYSAMYGLFFAAALAVIVFAINLSAIGFAMWQVGEPFSFTALQNAARSTQVAFAFIAVGSSLIAKCIALAAFYAVMAVPLASAAQASGLRAPSHAFFNGFGRSFIPLFCVFFASIFLQVYFGFFTTLYALLPILLSVVSVITEQALPDFDLEFILKGVASGGALLWLNAWLWSISALAFLKTEDTGTPHPVEPVVSDPLQDIRALRKSREQSF